MTVAERVSEAGAPRLERSRSDRMVAGVAGGLAASFGLHPAVFRVSFVVLTLMGGAGILVYLAAVLVLPDEGQEDSFATASLRRRRHRPALLIAVGLLAVVVLAALSEVPIWPAGDAWLFLLAAGALVLWLTGYAVADSRSGWLRGVAIVVAAAVLLLLLAVAAFLAAFDVDLGNGVDERRLAPASAGELREEHVLGLGELVFDLRATTFPPGETRLEVRVDAGRIHVLLPDGVALRASAEARLGGIDLLGSRVEGWEVDAQVDEPGARVLALDAEVGMGEIDVERSRP